MNDTYKETAEKIIALKELPLQDRRSKYREYMREFTNEKYLNNSNKYDRHIKYIEDRQKEIKKELKKIIIEFHIQNYYDENDGCGSFHSFHFPIDLKIGEEIWFSDYKHFLEKGEFLLPDSDTKLSSLDNLPDEAKVLNIRYGISDCGKNVKTITLKAI